MMGTAVENYLKVLQVKHSTDRLQLLENIIQQHQKYVPFDTVIQVLLHTEAVFDGREELIAPSLETYVDYYLEQGYGGTCFQHCWGLRLVLLELGYEVQFMALEEGHYSLAVKVGTSDYFVDVGFMAPLFHAYPLYQNWEVKSCGHELIWKYENQKGTMYRNGSKPKVWDGEFLTPEKFCQRWEMNIPRVNVFKKHVYVAKWASATRFIYCNESMYKEFENGVKILDLQLQDDLPQLESLLQEKLRVNPKLYIQAIVERDKKFSPESSTATNS